jgi:hypothetical protein
MDVRIGQPGTTTGTFGANDFTERNTAVVGLAEENDDGTKVLSAITRSVLITGFGGRGSRIALCARGPEELQRACGQLKQEGIEADFFPCDITAEKEI